MVICFSNSKGSGRDEKIISLCATILFLVSVNCAVSRSLSADGGSAPVQDDSGAEVLDGGEGRNDSGGSEVDASLLVDASSAVDASSINEIDGGSMPIGLGPWTGNDNVPASQSPPGDLPIHEVPMFVSMGWDDNAYSGLDGSGGTGAMTWASEMIAARTNPPGNENLGSYDGTPIKMSFYLTSIYAAMWMSESPTYVKRAWNRAFVDGNEIGNHTHNHAHGSAYTAQQWQTQVTTCMDWLSKPFDPNESNVSPDTSKGAGIPVEELYGFRTPFLEYNDHTFSVVKARGFWYDCSIEDGFQPDHDGSNFHWPYTLDSGSPGHDLLVEWGLKEPISNHPGLWELPVHPVIVPPDEKCAEYGVPSGLRAKLHAVQSWFDVESGKITGFDYNLWVSFQMTKAEFLATLKYTLDLRLEGNRAPFMFGTHTDYYSSKYTAANRSTHAERREAIEEFLDYALTKDAVRVVSNKQILDWVRNPSAI